MKFALACCLLLCMGGGWAAEWEKPSFCGERDCPRFQVVSEQGLMSFEASTAIQSHKWLQ